MGANALSIRRYDVEGSCIPIMIPDSGDSNSPFMNFVVSPELLLNFLLLNEDSRALTTVVPTAIIGCPCSMYLFRVSAVVLSTE